MWLDLGSMGASLSIIIYTSSEDPENVEGENHGVSNI